VLEHVGGFHNQLTFINEIHRVGHQFYFATPAKEFPLAIHTNYPFIHWLPKGVFNTIVKLLGKGWAAGDYMNLLTKADLEMLLRTSGVRTFRIITHRVGPFPLHHAVWGC
jgi:hypothetical protein